MSIDRPVDRLTDQELEEVNRKHPWVTATRDAKGRLVGRPGHPGAIFDIPERRVEIARDKLGLSGKRVVEFGSLEGGHTLGLLACGAEVTAIEGRAENVEKTRVRCALYGWKVDVRRIDVERDPIPSGDLFFHSGVLYHLEDPVAHLAMIAPLAPELLLDTHHAKRVDRRYVSRFEAKEYEVLGYKEPTGAFKAGLRPLSRWLPLDTLTGLLRRFYGQVEVVRNERSRNGPRATIVCKRASAAQ